jgi:CBS domain-containing protein
MPLMDIASLCRRQLVTVEASASVREAAVLMREQHVGALVVVSLEGERPRVVGVVTDRDLAVEVIARGASPADLQIGQLVARAPAAVPGSATVQESVAAMEKAGVRRLLVVDAEGGVTGLVSADDLVSAMAAELGGLARALRSGIARESAERGPIAPPRERPVFMPYGTPGMPWPAAPPIGMHAAA